MNNTKLTRLEKEKDNKLRLMISGIISSDEYYSFIDEYHKNREKILIVNGCKDCGSHDQLEYNSFRENFYCDDCWR